MVCVWDLYFYAKKRGSSLGIHISYYGYCQKRGQVFKGLSGRPLWGTTPLNFLTAIAPMLDLQLLEILQTKVVNCNNAYKSCHLLLLQTKVIVLRFQVLIFLIYPSLYCLIHFYKSLPWVYVCM